MAVFPLGLRPPWALDAPGLCSDAGSVLLGDGEKLLMGVSVGSPLVVRVCVMVIGATEPPGEDGEGVMTEVMIWVEGGGLVDAVVVWVVAGALEGGWVVLEGDEGGGDDGGGGGDDEGMFTGVDEGGSGVGVVTGDEGSATDEGDEAARVGEGDAVGADGGPDEVLAVPLLAMTTAERDGIQKKGQRGRQRQRQPGGWRKNRPGTRAWCRGEGSASEACGCARAVVPGMRQAG